MPVGLRINGSARSFFDLNPCTEEQAEDIKLLGAPLLANIDIEAEALRCEFKLVGNGPVYYASFSDDGASTVTQARFTEFFDDDLALACSVSGQNRFAGWNFDALDC